MIPPGDFIPIAEANGMILQTGQSNLSYIMEMPVHIVKFDKGMTDAFFENDRAKYIMDTAIDPIL